MLIVLSDLHFVDETAGKHNLPPDAFEEVFLSDIVELAVRKRAKEITLLLLGDIPDLIRSAHWFDVPPADRPWGENGLADVRNWRTLTTANTTPTERLCLRILGQMPASGRKEDVPKDTILYRNWEILALFRNLEAEIHQRMAAIQPGTLPPVRVLYIPGNHDRLINLYPSLREEWRKMAGLTVDTTTVTGNPQGQWWYRYDYQDEVSGVYGRHGHQFDLWNYGGGHDTTSLEAHLQVPIGDVIATEFAVGLVWQAQQMEHRIGHSLVERLEDIDNVRPMGRLLEWLYYEIEQNKRHRKAMDEITDAVVKNILNTPFVQHWRTPLTNLDEGLRATRGLRGLGDLVERLNTPGPDEFVRLATAVPLRWLFGKMLDFTDTNTLLQFVLFFMGSQSGSDDDADPYLQGAFREHIWQNNPNYHFVLYGHTHKPGIWALDGANNREVLYINTGTWRERIQRTTGLDLAADFIKLKQMTYVVIYGPEENGGWRGGNKAKGTPSFDMWTGSKLKHYR
ncbi:MAG: hypothetical protein KC443_03245 [Anaerolineales bacterium]|nr:hypothetical protein [Anaerolineales bacterium]